METENKAVSCEELEREFLPPKILKGIKGIELNLSTTERGIEGSFKVPWRAILCVAFVIWASSNHGEAARQALRFVIGMI